MTNGPYTWNDQDTITEDLFVGDPNTGLGITGQAAFITITVEKASTSLFYTGSDYTSAVPVDLAMTEVDATNSPGLYRFTLTAVDIDKYYMHVSVNNAPTAEGDDYSTHVVRDMDIKTYESEPVIL